MEAAKSREETLSSSSSSSSPSSGGLPVQPGFAPRGGVAPPLSLTSREWSALRCWLVLSYAPGVGPAMYLRLLSAFGAPEKVLNRAVDAARRFRLPAESLAALRRPDWERADRELGWLRERDGFLLHTSDQGFPEGLRRACPPVPFLFGQGDPGLLTCRQVAMVGSRAPSVQGRRIAERIAGDLADAGVIVTSGLARGIDGASHEGALRAGGDTIAVLGSGLGQIYPRAHRSLAQRVVEAGVLLSEHSPDVPPLPEHFPRRNRVISALSAATLVVEADLRSGSLITARHALEQGKDVFAVPGSVFNPLARGCHALLRQGAALVENAVDILRELNWEASSQGSVQAAPASRTRGERAVPEEPLSAEEQRLLDVMGWDPADADELAQRSGFSPEFLSASLFALELRGAVCAQLDGRYCRIPGS